MAKSTGSLQSETALKSHLVVVLEAACMALGMALELCGSSLLPDTFLDLPCISMNTREVSGKGSVPYLAG